MTGSKTANYVYAAPNGSAGSPSFRKLVSDDIPSLAASKITSGTVAAARLPISTTQTNSTTKVPSYSLVYSMQTKIDSLSSSIEQKVYSNWADRMSENKNSSGTKYFTLPDGVSNVKKIDFYFNETPYAEYSYSGSQYTSTDPVAYNTVVLTPGSSKNINQSRCAWRMGVETDGRPYMYTSSDVGGSYCYWNIALTFYI